MVVEAEKVCPEAVAAAPIPEAAAKAVPVAEREVAREEDKEGKVSINRRRRSAGRMPVIVKKD